MNLHEAVLIGNSLKKSTSNLYLVKHDGEYCGCALGGALLALGYEGIDADYSLLRLQTVSLLREHYPWFKESHEQKISVMYHDVADGEMTIEELVDEIKKMEPAEEAKVEENDRNLCPVEV